MTSQSDRELKQLEEELREPLSRWLVDPVTPDSTARLIASLQPEFDALRGAALPADAARGTGRQPLRPSLLRLMRAQLAAYSRSFWAASLAVFVMVALVLSYGSQPPYNGMRSSFSFFMPAFLLAGLLYSFRTWSKGMRTIEHLTPYPPALLLLCRMLLVIAMNAAYGLLCTVYFAQRIEAFPFLPFLLGWLSQMLLIGGLLAYLMLWKGMKTAIAGGLLLWIVWNAADLSLRAELPGGLASFQLAALAAGAALLGLAYRRSLGMRRLPGAGS